MAIQRETDLYEPVKQFLIRQGYEVRGEVNHCDLVAMRENEPPMIVELKKTFNLPLVIQALERLRQSDRVYVAVATGNKGKAPHGLRWSDLVNLCRRIGIGLIIVRFYKTKPPFVEVLCHPEPAPSGSAPSRVRAKRLVDEFRGRSGDYNIGGSTGRRLVTSYREKAIQCAYAMSKHGPLTTAQLRQITGSSKVTSILQHNYYGWFRRVRRGTYELTPAGIEALQQYEHIARKLDI